MNPYLIQRCSRKPANYKPGFDAKFQCDYMGSAEFEYGALPKSLQEFTRSCDQLEIHSTGVRNYEHEELFVLCTDEVWEEYKENIAGLVEEKFHLKECSHLKREMTGVHNGVKLKPSPYRTALWWDVENTVMFGFGQGVIADALKGIREVRDKKREEGDSEWLN